MIIYCATVTNKIYLKVSDIANTTFRPCLATFVCVIKNLI